jgi:hypothetical protein
MVSRAEEGKHHVLTLDGTGNLTLSTADGDVPGLDLDARPPALMRIFGKQIARAKMQATAAAKMFGGPAAKAGMDVEPMIAGMFAFPEQIERLKIQANGNPMDPDEGLSLSLDFQPVADSGFARFAGALQTNQAGAPVLGDADLTMRFAIAKEASKKILEGFLPMLTSFGMKQSDELSAMMLEMLGHYDGCGSATFDFAGGGMNMAFGVDGPKAAALLGSERYRNLMQTAYADSELFEEAPKMGSSEHRGVGITEVSMEFGEAMAQNPMLGGSPTANTFTAVAGNLMLSSMAKDGSRIRGLIDAALDKKVATSPLPEGALVTMDLALAKMAQMFAGPAAEGAPEHVGIALLRSGPGVVLRIKVK